MTDKPRYWYEFYEEECVLCWRYYEYKVRRYTPKPENYGDRHHFSQYLCGDHYDYC